MMILKKIVFILIFSISLFGAEKAERKDFLQYSKVVINDNISVYAAEVDMKHYEQDEMYSVGLLLNSSKESDLNFAVGYAHPSYTMGFLSEERTSSKDDTVVCYMNYSF